MALEYKKIGAPASFDYRNPAHVSALIAKLAEAGLGDGWQVQGFDEESKQVLVSRQSAVVAVSGGGGGGVKRVGLGGRFGPSDGQKAAEQLESRPEFAGLKLVSFRPHIDEAVLAPLSDSEINARSKIASVLSVKPWEVQVAERAGGGFVAQLPPDRYLPAKHDEKLQETVENGIGRFGWYIDVDKSTAKMNIVPDDPPTFDAVIPYPQATATAPAKGQLAWQMQVPVGEVLPGPGESARPLALDLDGTVGVLTVGLAGSGKSVTINSLIYGLLARGWEVLIGDVAPKAVDFAWCKPWVRQHGFGVRSQRETAAVVSELFELVQERATLLQEHGVQKWQELPDAVRPAPIALVIDELQGLLAKEVEPKSLPREHPLRTEAVETNMAVDIMLARLSKLMEQARFVGIRVILATQQAQQNTGVPPKVKQNLPNRLLCGVNPDQGARRHAFQNETAVPTVPAHIQSDAAAARGVGMFEFEGVTPGVFKGYYATTDTYRAWLTDAQVPRTTNQDVPTSIVDKHFGSSLDDDDDEGGFGRGPRQLEEWEIGADGKPLTGYARANAARAQATVEANG